MGKFFWIALGKDRTGESHRWDWVHGMDYLAKSIIISDNINKFIFVVKKWEDEDDEDSRGTWGINASQRLQKLTVKVRL